MLRMKIDIKKVTKDDMLIVLDWWNDKTTRAMMKDNEKVTLSTHKNWFDRILSTNSNQYLLMAYLENKKIGVVRFDEKNENIFEVSINLNPDFRSKGLGKLILKEAISYFQGIKNIKKMFAVFKKVNIASKKTFLQNNFEIKNNIPNITLLNNFDKNSELYSERIFDV